MSRLNRDLLSQEKLNLTASAREHLANYRRNQDLISIGAYPAGSSSAIDLAIALREPLNRFLRQDITEGFDVSQSWSLLMQALSTPASLKQPQPRR